MITLSIILTVVVLTSFFIIRNLILKTEKQEDELEKYENFITKQSEAIIVCDKRLQEVDDKGIFYSDDEIGWFFKEVQKIQDALNEFTLK